LEIICGERQFAATGAAARLRACLETRDTADLEVCATPNSRKSAHSLWTALFT
jgi:hypothetical protein